LEFGPSVPGIPPDLWHDTPRLRHGTPCRKRLGDDDPQR
jgi:hypothetical protein